MLWSVETVWMEDGHLVGSLAQSVEWWRNIELEWFVTLLGKWPGKWAGCLVRWRDWLAGSVAQAVEQWTNWSVAMVDLLLG
ncbi:hypothetical protein TIFTF001_032812 [Ficus carica]|uniref:Uncharacterized protein n=1 Tax=Ficus carica TaxID=3494 RepID=A0AA88DX24_FICCA|nr:hypothetical protein TIFTF001_032812 [Ficus carica]